MEERRQIDHDASIANETAAPYGHHLCGEINEKGAANIGQLVKKEMAVPDARASLVRRQAAEVLRRARRLPVGPDRNDLRQLAIGLLWLDKKGLSAKALRRAQALPD
jgi:hypothetical protein